MGEVSIQLTIPFWNNLRGDDRPGSTAHQKVSDEPRSFLCGHEGILAPSLPPLPSGQQVSSCALPFSPMSFSGVGELPGFLIALILAPETPKAWLFPTAYQSMESLGIWLGGAVAVPALGNLAPPLISC